MHRHFLARLARSLITERRRMRKPIVLTLAMALASSAALCETLYARPDLAPAGYDYRWESKTVAESITLQDAIAVAKAANGSDTSKNLPFSGLP
jgi:hypothetical protein